MAKHLIKRSSIRVIVSSTGEIRAPSLGLHCVTFMNRHRDRGSGDSRLLTIYNISFRLVNMASRSASMSAQSASAIALLRTHSLATLAHRELERRILAGDLPSGTKLNAADVAATLGNHRGPVRD